MKRSHIFAFSFLTTALFASFTGCTYDTPSTELQAVLDDCPMTCGAEEFCSSSLECIPLFSRGTTCEDSRQCKSQSCEDGKCS